MGVSAKLARCCWLELSAGTGGIHYAILSTFVLCSKFSIMKKIKMGIDNASSVLTSCAIFCLVPEPL